MISNRYIKKYFFTDWFEETEDRGTAFPSCEYLLRDNWYVADPIPLDVVNEGIPDNQQLDPAYCNQVRYTLDVERAEIHFTTTHSILLVELQHSVVNSQYIEMLLRMGKTVVGVETWKQRGESCGGNFEEMLFITDEVLIVWTVDGQYNGWCHEFGKRTQRTMSNQKKRLGRGLTESD